MPTQAEIFTLGAGRCPIITITATPTLISALIAAADPTIDLSAGVVNYIIRGKNQDGTNRGAILSGFRSDELNLYSAAGVDDDTPVRGDRYVQRYSGDDVDAVVLIGKE